MSTAISIRIPRRLREEMDKLRDMVNWSEETRRLIERRVEELKRIKVLDEVRRVIEELPEVPRGTITGYVRNDRDNH